MKRFLAIALAASLGLFAYAGTASAAASNTLSHGAAANGIVKTRHNLGELGKHFAPVYDPTTAPTSANTAGTTEVCVFCHTPHHTNRSNAATDGQPLWNRKIDTAGKSYVAYGTTVAGANVSAIGGASAACLSCHDGVTAFDAMYNGPGAGLFDSTAAAPGWSWSDEGTYISKFGDFTGDTRTNLGTDLSNDHPISITYNTTHASLRVTNTTLSSIDLSSGFGQTSFDAYNVTRNLWAVGGIVDSTATIQDLLKGNNNDTVECSSCHDPHFANSTGASSDQGFWGGTWSGKNDTDGLFLRRVGGNVGSAVCRTCHNK